VVEVDSGVCLLDHNLLRFKSWTQEKNLSDYCPCWPSIIVLRCLPPQFFSWTLAFKLSSGATFHNTS
jgi:hypothetical protein